MIAKHCRVCDDRLDPRRLHTQRLAGVWRKLLTLLQHGTAAADCRHRSQNPREFTARQLFNSRTFRDLARPSYERIAVAILPPPLPHPNFATSAILMMI